MSVQCNQYIGYGYFVNLKALKEGVEAIPSASENPWDAFCEEHGDSAFNTKIVAPGGVSVLIYGMDGNCFLGKVFAKGSDGQCLSSMAMPKVSGKDKKLVEEKYKTLLGEPTKRAQMCLFTLYR